MRTFGNFGNFKVQNFTSWFFWTNSLYDRRLFELHVATQIIHKQSEKWGAEGHLISIVESPFGFKSHVKTVSFGDG